MGDDPTDVIMAAQAEVRGRFVPAPTPGMGASLGQRVGAVALADQVGAVLAARRPEVRRHAHG